MTLHDSKRCKYCGKSVISHRKCKQCGILLHKKNSNYACKTGGQQYTLEGAIEGYCLLCCEAGIKETRETLPKSALKI